MHNVHGLEGVSLAAADAARLAAFWQVALGDHPEGMVRVTEGVPACSETGRVKLGVRLHPAGPGDLLAAGGTVLRHPGPDPWYLLADPDGNEFLAHASAFLRPGGARPVGGPAADRTSAAGLPAGLPLGVGAKPA